MKKYSVVIPFYSQASWLDEALDSVKKQTVAIDEIIVVNDGSKEDISYLKEKYPEVIFVDQKNQGAAAARNTGIRVSTGDILFFLDSDDIWTEDKVEKQAAFMETNGYKWSATDYETFGAGKREIVCQKPYTGLCWEKLYSSCSIQTSTVAIAREALFEKNFDTTMKNGQDVYLWFKLANHYPMGILSETLTKFRLRGTNAHLSITTHIRVRALLWERMEYDNELLKAKRKLTRLGYKICYAMYKRGKDNNGVVEVKNSAINKSLFTLAWLLFRFDLLLQNRD